MKPALSVRMAVVGFAFASGAAGLAHQLLWTRRLVDVLGAGPGTFARVIGAFFAGLALGAAWAAWRPVDASRGWRRVAWAEGWVATLAVPMFFAVPIGDWLRGAFGTDAVGWVLPLLLVVPPAVAMGFVFPALAVARGTSGAGLMAVYASNTAGGLAGLLGVVFWLLPAAGTDRSSAMAAATNAVLAVGAALLSSGVAGNRWMSKAEPAGGVPSGWPSVGAMVLSFGSGYWLLGFEVAMQQHLAQVSINSQFSGATVLGAVLLALVIGAVLSHATGWMRRTWPWVAAGAVLVAFEPWLLQALRPGLESIPYRLSPVSYHLRVALIVGVVAVPAVSVMGVVFPRLLRAESVRGAEAGRTVAGLLAVNGLGGLLGAETMSAWFLPSLGLWWPMTIWAALGAAMAWVCRGREGRGEGRPTNWSWRVACMTGVWMTGAVAGLTLSGWLAGRLPQATPVPGSRTVAVRAGREGVVAVLRREEDDRWITFNNSYTLGGSRAQANQERQAHLPILLHGSARSVGVLGLATGGTLGGVVLHPGVEQVVVAELSPVAAGFAREHFAPWNRNALDDPRVRCVIEDGRLTVRDRPGEFDVVIGDLFLPWRTGEGRMYSREHFAAVRRSLREGGLFCQWLPMFQLTRGQFDTVARTLQREFGEALVVRGDFYAEFPILGLVGWRDGRVPMDLGWSGVEAGCAQLRTGQHGRVTDGLVRHASGVAMCVVGVLPDAGDGPVNTLGNGWLEWDAGRNIVGLRQPWFIGVPLAESIRGWHRGYRDALEPARLGPHDAGQFFLTLDVAHRVGAPVLPVMLEQVADRIPEELRADSAVDWQIWPSRVKPGPGGTPPR